MKNSIYQYPRCWVYMWVVSYVNHTFVRSRFLFWWRNHSFNAMTLHHSPVLYVFVLADNSFMCTCSITGWRSTFRDQLLLNTRITSHLTTPNKLAITFMVHNLSDHRMFPMSTVTTQFGTTILCAFPVQCSGDT